MRLALFTATLGVAVAFSPLQIFAQNTGSIDELRAPSAPAYFLLGAAPKTIDRPTTPAKLGAALLTLPGGSGLNSGTGVEVTPFWYFDHTYLTYEEFLDPDPLLSTIAQTFAVSVATGKTDFMGDTAGAGISYGIRLQLIKGAPNKSFRSYFRKVYLSKIVDVEAVLNNMKGLSSKVFNGRATIDQTEFMGQVGDLVESAVKIVNSTPAFTPVPNSEVPDLKTKISNELKLYIPKDPFGIDTVKGSLARVEDSLVTRGGIAKIMDSLNTLGGEREGLTIELSGAGLTDFVHNVYDQSFFAKGAAWINAGYAFPGGIDFSLSAKYIYNAPRIDSSSDLDIGASLGYHSSAFSISGEGIYRKSNDSLNGSQSKVVTQYVTSWKWDVNANYKLSEGFSIVGTFGKDFKVLLRI
jgi:hypothetical protein